jgi:HSP90 family molecular chaperone
VQNPTVTVEVSGTIDVSSGTAMSIDPSGMAHVMSILTNLYADAPLAVLREYATNARDSHVAAGTDRPIEVDLPSDLNPTLVIRDFGVGLSEAEIIDVYARYGASTKRDTNDQVGAFGLGCKSAFTLGQQFVVTAVKDGQRTVALFALSGDGAGGVTRARSRPYG